MNHVYTIGHSTRSIEEFIEILHTYEVGMLVDVRRLPGSNKYPQFNQEALEKSLAKENIRYHHIEKLGGRRKGDRESSNTGWRNKSFRAYADYMQTKEFHEGLDELLSLAKSHTICMMCAEAVPWRCHRSLIADALLVRHIAVEDIFSKSNSKTHKLTPWATVKGQTITYPPQPTKA